MDDACSGVVSMNFHRHAMQAEAMQRPVNLAAG